MPLDNSTTYINPMLITVSTVANLRLVSIQLVDGALALLTDGLAGGTAAFYRYDVDDTQADNGTTIVKPASVTNGRWLRCGGTL